mgnify:CR=1 FL=1
MIDYLNDNRAGDLDLERNNRLRQLNDELAFDLAELGNNQQAIQRRQFGYLRDRNTLDDYLNRGVQSGRFDPLYGVNKTSAEIAASNRYEPAYDTTQYVGGRAPGQQMPDMDDYWRRSFENQARYADMVGEFMAARDRSAARDYLSGFRSIDGGAALREAQDEQRYQEQLGLASEASRETKRAEQEAKSIFGPKVSTRASRPYYLYDPNGYPGGDDGVTYTGISGTPRRRNS